MAAPTPLALFLLFGRLGFTAFGGPAVHLALIEDEVVTKRGWMTRADFLDRVGVTNLIPGPNSTEVVLHVGLTLAGFRGFWAAGLGFTLPAVAIVVALAAAYVAWGAVPTAAGALIGARPVIAAIVAAVAWRLAPTAWAKPLPRALGIGTAVLALAGLHELVLLLGAGLAGIAAQRIGRAGGTAAAIGAVPGGMAGLGAQSPGAMVMGGTAAVAAVGAWPLFAAFFKIGAVLYGSGYVLIALLRAELVEGARWISEGQLIDAVAIGQVTPGPLSATATFVGYLLGGPLGALAATAGIFAPAFALVALSGPLLPRLRSSAAAAAFLDGVNAASLGLLVVAAVYLARAAALGPTMAIAGLVALVALVRFRADATLLLAAGALAGAGATFL